MAARRGPSGAALDCPGTHAHTGPRAPNINDHASCLGHRIRPCQCLADRATTHSRARALVVAVRCHDIRSLWSHHCRARESRGLQHTTGPPAPYGRRRPHAFLHAHSHVGRQGTKQSPKALYAGRVPVVACPHTCLRVPTAPGRRCRRDLGGHNGRGCQRCLYHRRLEAPAGRQRLSVGRPHRSRNRGHWRPSCAARRCQHHRREAACPSRRGPCKAVAFERRGLDDRPLRRLRSL